MQGKADPRHELLIVGTDERAAVAILSGKTQQRRRVRTWRSEIGRRQIDTHHLIVGFVQRLVIAIAETQVQGQVGKQLPIILHVVGITPLARSECAALTTDLAVGRLIQFKVGVTIAGGGAKAGITAARSVAARIAEGAQNPADIAGVEIVLLVTHELRAELGDVLAMNPSQIIPVDKVVVDDNAACGAGGTVTAIV